MPATPQPSTEYPLRTFEGLHPELDRRQVPTPYVMDGANFFVNSAGPNSYLGSNWVPAMPFAHPNLVQSFRVNSNTLIFTQDAIILYDVATGSFSPIYKLTQSNPATLWPWTMGYVGNVYYFARLGNKLLQYNPVTQAVAEITSQYIPDTIYACCGSGGRLVLLGQTLVLWSTQDNGIDFQPQLSTGAGFNPISTGPGGNPMMLAPTSDGFITFTDNGLMKSQFNGSGAIYNHYGLSINALLINPWCVVQLPYAGVFGDKAAQTGVVFLTKTGLMSTVGAEPVVFEPGFSEYIQETFIPTYGISELPTIRLHYSTDLKWLLLSVGTGTTSFVYSKAYLFYLPSKKWGSFDAVHCGFIELYFGSQNAIRGYNFGFVDTAGYVYTFNETPNYIGPYLDGTTEFWNATYNPPAILETVAGGSPVQIFPSLIQADTWNILPALNYNCSQLTFTEIEEIAPALADYTQLAAGPYSGGDFPTIYASGANFDLTKAYIDTNGDTGFPSMCMSSSGASIWRPIVAMPHLLVPNSYIDVGLIEFSSGQYTDELSQIVDLAIGTPNSIASATSEDWNAQSSTSAEDWNNSNLPNEDWGYSAQFASTYEVLALPTIDGYNEFNGGSQIPVVYKQDAAMVYYKAFTTGRYHIIRLTAQNVGDSFHLNLLDIDAVSAGRI